MSRLGKRDKRGVGRRNCSSVGGDRCCEGGTKSSQAAKQAVRKDYADLVKSPPRASGGPCAPTAAELAGYTAEQLDAVPEELRETIFACGNPVAFAGIKEGQVVLDIGSGAGLDALLAAKKVGPAGKVIGLDMTPEMIETARANASKAGAANVEFRMGDAEAMPVEDASCDWIISNCVINLAPDKGRVFSEACRVLKPGGRLMVSDIVTHDLPAEVRENIAAWTRCIGGAPEEEEYLRQIRAAGFEDVEILARKTYQEDLLRGMAACCSCEEVDEAASRLVELVPQIAGHVSSVLISAVKPPARK